MRYILDLILYMICGIPVVFAVDEDDPELWNNPRKRARIRRRIERRERRRNGKKANV